MPARPSGAHEAAVARLRDAYAAVPPGAPVRLAKRTSNLFRFRDGPGGRRPRPAARRLRVRPRAARRPRRPDRRGRRHDHLRGPRRRDAAARADAAGGARSSRRSPSAARSPASASSPPRCATACRTSRCTEMEILTGDGRVVVATAGQRARRPVPRLPELLRHARLRLCAHHRARAGQAVRAPAALPRSTDPRPAWTPIGADRRGAAATAATGPTSSTAPRSAPTSSTSPSARSATWPRGAATTPASRSTTSRSGGDREDFLTIRDYLWRWDTDWFWCSRRVRRAEPAGPPAVAAPVPALGRLPQARRAWTGSYGLTAALDAAAAAGRRGSWSSRTSRSRSSAAPSSCGSSPRSGDEPGVDVPAAAARRPRLAAVPDASPARST